ncbi:MAG: queuosine precursor transporter [Paramuribaculum sp.]|nr:queuosine precursor transporter [Paramuribaculum sp.]
MNQPTRQISMTFLLLAVTFCVCLITANLMEIKTVPLGPFTITAGVVVFPVSYIIADCVVEIYGLRRARQVIWLGFAANLFVSIMLQIGILLPGTDSWHSQEAMTTMFGAVPRIFAASFIAFLAGSMVNAYVMHRMRLAHPDGSRFSLRAIVSTLFGEGADSLIFFPIAFAGELPAGVIISLIATQALLKTLYEIIILPVTIQVVNLLRRIEDRHIHTEEA